MPKRFVRGSRRHWRLTPILAKAARQNSARLCDTVFWRPANGCGRCWCFWRRRLVADRSNRPLPAACAVEMIHAYSLIHDDLPAMDDDDLRRGRPTCHKAFDEATAILAGDALLTLAFDSVGQTHTSSGSGSRCVARLWPRLPGRVIWSADRPTIWTGMISPGGLEPSRIDRPSKDRGADSGLPSTGRNDSSGRRRTAFDTRRIRPQRRAGVPDHRRSARCSQQRTIAGQTSRQGRSNKGNLPFPAFSVLTKASNMLEN